MMKSPLALSFAPCFVSFLNLEEKISSARARNKSNKNLVDEYYFST